MQGFLIPVMLVCALTTKSVNCSLPRDKYEQFSCKSLRDHVDGLPLEERGDLSQHLVLKTAEGDYIDCGEQGNPS